MIKRRKETNDKGRKSKKSTPADCRAVAVKKTREREKLEEAALPAIKKVTGTQGDEASFRILHQAANALVWPLRQEDAIINAVSMMAEMAPQNMTEAMLSIQMIAVNEAALMYLSRATLPDQHPHCIDPNVIRATRLMRIFNEQIEAMQKLKGKGSQQKVTVEHVHVYEGGQAIVGPVTAPAGGGGQ
jgi:hypothetical protein